MKFVIFPKIKISESLIFVSNNFVSEGKWGCVSKHGLLDMAQPFNTPQRAAKQCPSDGVWRILWGCVCVFSDTVCSQLLDTVQKQWHENLSESVWFFRICLNFCLNLSECSWFLLNPYCIRVLDLSEFVSIYLNFVWFFWSEFVWFFLWVCLSFGLNVSDFCWFCLTFLIYQKFSDFVWMFVWLWCVWICLELFVWFWLTCWVCF